MSKDRSFTSAIHILTALAAHDPELASSDRLAVGMKTNPGLVRRVLSKLVEAGLVDSVKGKNGGYRLAKSAKDISLQDVYRAIKEGPLFGSFDKDPYKACPVSCNIGDVLSKVYSRLEGDLCQSMKAVKLSEIVKQVM